MTHNNLAQVNLNQIEQNGLPGFRFAGGTVGNVITAALPYIFTAAGTLLLIYLVIGGIGYMTAQGDPKAIAGAQAKITYALLGFVIIFIAFWLTQAAGLILGLQPITAIFGR